MADNPVIVLVKVPVPEPSVVCKPVATGLAVVDQQTPRAVTGEPPSEVTFPPESAPVSEMPVTASVVTTAAPGVNVRSLPVVVPSALTATTLKWYVVPPVSPEMPAFTAIFVVPLPAAIVGVTLP